MTNRITMIILLVIMAAGRLNSEIYYRSPFTLGLGAREIALGGTGVAGSGGTAAIFWNPALLALTDRAEIQLFHTALFMDTRYEYVAAAFPTTSAGVFGIGLGDLASGKFIRYRSDFSDDGTFSSRQNQLSLSYGFLPYKSIAIGMAVKGVLFDIDRYRDSGFGIDFGLSYRPPFLGGLTTGLRVSDILGPRIRLDRTEQRFPYAVRVGLGYGRNLSQTISATANFDLEKFEQGGSEIYTGAELGISKLVFVRTGFRSDRFVIGGGLAYSGLRFDYAYVPLNELGASHRMSLIFAFGSSVEQKRIADREKALKETLGEIDKARLTERQRKIDSLLAAASRFESGNELLAAIDCYYRVLGIDDQHAEASQKAADLFERIRLDIGRRAGDQFVTAIVSKQIELGESYLAKNQFDRAEEQFRFVLLLDPENKIAPAKMASIEKSKAERIGSLKIMMREAISAGDNQRALSTIEEILRLNPNDGQALENRGRILGSLEASRHLDNALQLFSQENYSQAAASADSALAINPRLEGARNLKTKLSQYTARETTLEDIKKNPEHWRIYLDAMDKYQAGDYRGAQQLWQSLLRDYPNNPNLKRNIEQAAERAGKK